MLTRDRKPALGCGTDEGLSPVEKGWWWEKRKVKGAQAKGRKKSKGKQRKNCAEGGGRLVQSFAPLL